LNRNLISSYKYCAGSNVLCNTFKSRIEEVDALYSQLTILFRMGEISLLWDLSEKTQGWSKEEENRGYYIITPCQKKKKKKKTKREERKRRGTLRGITSNFGVAMCHLFCCWTNSPRGRNVPWGWRPPLSYPIDQCYHVISFSQLEKKNK
jgi:hypothetical protein